ncbi:RNA polymerase sigma factor [Mobilicoccus massiliensis]|uniref:RNA polymerase sigma factor n=1 Tax=Mobilicoccus massiliensis TaxID=1522310 RepID=UPI0005903FC8|nr:sigma-70 family RNA polymerase sigma factor [Mobilicoccus massiliensis]
MITPTEREERFRTAYLATYDDLLRYVRRRLDRGAEDVVAEAMTIAWRRVDDLPADLGDGRAWIFGIARNCLLNQRRTHRRTETLGVRLADAGRTGATDDVDLVVSRVDLARAWAGLSAREQEVLALVVFEDLDSTRAGRVLGISPVAVRLRLSRARRALRLRLEGAATDAPPQTQEIRP